MPRLQMNRSLLGNLVTKISKMPPASDVLASVIIGPRQ